MSEFWDRVETVNAGMLDVAGDARWVPMSHQADRSANMLWFLTAAGTRIVNAVAAGQKTASYLLADNAQGLFAQVTGSLAVSNDHARLAQMWTPIAGAWFGGGIDAPNLRLLSFSLSGGEVWTTSSGLRFMFNIAKANLTGAVPAMGEHFTL